jgi:hypothetical protein
VGVCVCAYMHIALLIQHATLMRHVVMSFAAPRRPPHFSTLSHKRYDFRKKIIEHTSKMRVFIFCTTFVQNISRSKKNLARYLQKSRNFFMQTTRYFCHTVMKFEFSRQIFEKVSNIKFHQNLSSGIRVQCGQEDSRRAD